MSPSFGIETLAIGFAGHNWESIIMDNTQSQTTNRGAATKSTAQAEAPHTCCGGPARAGTSACCALDAEVKSAGGAGCGCGSAIASPVAKKSTCCG
jgi:hypothetical protein